MKDRSLVTVTRRVRLAASDKTIDRIVALALAGARFRRPVEVGVTFVGDAEMRRLNCKWRRHDRTTDVLSFQERTLWPVGEGTVPFLGDIVISPAQVKRQSRADGISETEEFARIIIHGVLHLLGHDHVRKADAAKMFPLQERILKRLSL